MFMHDIFHQPERKLAHSPKQQPVKGPELPDCSKIERPLKAPSLSGACKLRLDTVMELTHVKTSDSMVNLQ